MVRDHYDVASYRRAIARGCEQAGVPTWGPHRLRHNAGTKLRKALGLDSAQVVLGHSSANITEVYAMLDQDKARSAIKALE